MALDRELQDLLDKLKALRIPTSDFEKTLRDANSSAEDIRKTTETMRTTLRGAQAEARGLSTEFSDLYETLNRVVQEISKADSALNKSKKGYRSLTSEVQKLKNEEEGIYDFNSKQLDKMLQKAKAAKVEIELQAKNLTAEEKLTEAGQAILKAQEEGFTLEKDAVNKIQERLKLEHEVEKTLGATNALLTTSNKLLSGLGFSHLSTEISDLQSDLRGKLRAEIKAGGKDVNKVGLGFKYMAKGAGGVGKIFANGLMDPLFIAGQIANVFFKLNKVSVESQRLTGQTATSFNILGNRAASAVDVIEQANELTKELGYNAENVFSYNVLANAADLKVEMGLTAQQAGAFAMYAQTSGKSVDSLVDSTVSAVSNFNKANRSAVSQGVVLRDVANTSKDIALSLGNNPASIAKAAAAARRLGLDLKKVDAIAGSLMNFESSIEAELEAQLLTGRQMNLSKARELALANDLEGLSKELFKNSVDIHEFGKMNRIQQEAQAKALGMTREELAKIAYNRALETGMTEEQAAAAAKVNAEDMKRMEMQENFTKALEKIAGALSPILNFVADILSIPFVPYILLGAAAMHKLGGGLFKSAAGLKDMVGKAKELGTSLVSSFKSGQKPLEAMKSSIGGLMGKSQTPLDAFKAAKAKGLSDKQILSGFGGKEAKDAMMIPADKAKGAADTMKTTSDGAKSANGIQKGIGERIKEFFTGLAEGLKKMGTKDVFMGALGALAAAPGLLAMGLAAPGLFLLSMVPGQRIQEALAGIGAGLKEMGTTDVFMGALGALAASPGILAMGIAAPGLMLLSMVPGRGVQQALTGLAKGLSALGKAAMDPMLWVGVAALAGIGASMIPLTYSLSLLAPLLEAVGTVITSVFGGIAAIITAVANGFVNLMGALSMDNILPLLLLGPALIGIAAGLSMLGPAGIIAIPGIAALGALAAMAIPLAAIGSLFGGGEDEGNNDSKVEEKLDAILAAIQAGGNVYIDGNQVGQALVLGSYKSS